MNWLLNFWDDILEVLHLILFPDFQFYAACDGCASPGYDRFEREYGVQNTGKVLASTSKSTIRS